MDPRHHSFLDDRLLALCPICRAQPPSTRDHVPAKIFLDDPLPSELQVIPMCRECNQGASLDEEYTACIIDVARIGSCTAGSLRPKVTSALRHSPPLRSRLRHAEHSDKRGVLGYFVEHERMARVMRKIGQGLLASEGSDAVLDQVLWHTLETANAAQDLKEEPPGASPFLLPEVGSLALDQAVTNIGSRKWRTIQAGRFEYRLDYIDQSTSVRMLFSDYLIVELKQHDVVGGASTYH